jgi:mannitol/fructose-specific phosphotransferase system IIA component (Ntr-type)
VKDLFGRDRSRPLDLRALARPYLTFTPDVPLEQALVRFQRSHRHLAVVVNPNGRWTGILALEDVLEDVVGQIHDEFEREPPALEDVVRASQVLLDVPAESADALVERLLAAVPADAFVPAARREDVVRALLDRERTPPTWMGRGVMIPHAKTPGLRRPVVVFARVSPPLRVEAREEGVRLAFLLLTPASDPRTHLRLLDRIANVADSDYVLARLEGVSSREEAVEVMAAAANVASS